MLEYLQYYPQVEVPSALKVLSTLKSRNVYTPDFNRRIEQHKYHVVFIDNQFQSFCRDDDETYAIFGKEEPIFLGNALAFNEVYVMRRSAYVTFTLYEPNNAKAKAVMGEAYALTPFQIARLDNILSNGFLFNREKSYIQLLEQTAPYKNSMKRPVLEAFHYIVSEDTIMKKVTHFAPYKLYGTKQVWYWDNNSSFVVD